ncbi:MAG: hypothetical protein AAF694_01920 [Bacteroidota bacterium]
MALTRTYRKSSKRIRRNIPLEEYEAQKGRKRSPKRPSISPFPFRFPKIKRVALFMGIGVSTLLLLGLANGYQHQIPCRGVEFHLHGQGENLFLNEDDLRMLVELEFGRELEGAKLDEIVLSDLEKGVEGIPFVQKAEVYKTLTGVLHIETWFRSPVARMVTDRGNHIYLDETGNKFPVSLRESANVLLIRGNIEERLVPADTLQQEGLAEALPLLNFIHKHDFWNAQLSEMILDEQGSISFTTLFGDTRIEFGEPERIEEKFKNLRLFYDQVLSKGAWKTYKEISVKYKGQVKTVLK